MELDVALHGNIVRLADSIEIKSQMQPGGDDAFGALSQIGADGVGPVLLGAGDGGAK